MFDGLDGPISKSERESLRSELRKMEEAHLFEEVDAQTQTAGWDPTMFLPDNDDEYSECTNDLNINSDSDENLGSLGKVLLQKPSKLIPPVPESSGRSDNSYIQCMKLRQLKALKGDIYTLTVNNSYSLASPEDLCREFKFLLYSVAEGRIPVENIKLFINTETGPKMSADHRQDYETAVNALNLPDDPEMKKTKEPCEGTASTDNVVKKPSQSIPNKSLHPFMLRLTEGVIVKHLYLPRKNIKLSLKNLELNQDTVHNVYPTATDYPPTFSEFLVSLCKKSKKWTYLKNTYNLLDV